MFVGKYWLRDAEGVIRTELEQTGRIKPYDIRAAIESLCNLTRIVETDLIEMALDEAFPLPDNIIPIRDGLLNLLDKTITSHSPDYFYTEFLPRKYIKDAVPEHFLAFLDKMFTGDPDAKIKITHIFETIAWILMRNYKIQGAVVLFGQGGEGKSVIHDIMEKLIVHTSELTLDELENEKFKRYKLYGSWANLISESSAKMVSSEMFKRVTDGSTITVEEKNGKPFKMKSHAKMILDTNELPNKEDELRAFYRRVIAIIDFPNMLDNLMAPKEIDNAIAQLESEEELDKIFSYVVDMYYRPLVERMRFTNQLGNKEAKKLWEERSNPALAYLRRRDDAGEIITDIESAKSVLAEAHRSESMYITNGNDNSEEYIDTPKQEVINDAIKWATQNGFPVKNINAGALGKAINSLGYQNITVNKKLGKGVIIKAWKDLMIISWTPVTVTVTDDEKRPLLPKIIDSTGSRASSNGYVPLPASSEKNKIYRIGEEEGIRNRKVSDQQNQQIQTVTGESPTTVTEPLPSTGDSDGEPDNSDADKENDSENAPEKNVTKIVDIPYELKMEAIRLLDRKYLADPNSVACEKSNVARSLSEYDLDGKHVSGLMTRGQFYTVMKTLYDSGKIIENGKKWNRQLLFYKSKTEYGGEYVEAFTHKNYHYYMISGLAIDDGSKGWISWLSTAIAISEKEFETMKETGIKIRNHMYYSVFVPLMAYLIRGVSDE